MIIVYKILLITLKVILFAVQTLGIYFIIHYLPKYIKRKDGECQGTFETTVGKDLQDTVDKNIIPGKMPVTKSTGLCGKVITIRGIDYLVMGENIETLDTRLPARSRVSLILYRKGKLKDYLLYPEDADKFYRKYSKTGPVRSREIRRDVRSFCNSACIQDCTECILKKYGKGHKAE